MHKQLLEDYFFVCLSIQNILTLEFLWIFLLSEKQEEAALNQPLKMLTYQFEKKRMKGSHKT